MEALLSPIILPSSLIQKLSAHSGSFRSLYLLALFLPSASILSISESMALTLDTLRSSISAISLVFAVPCSCKYSLIFS